MNPRPSRYCIAALLPMTCLCVFAHAEPANNSPSPDQLAFFETSIRPVLADHCLDCHSGDDPENGLSLESRAAMLQGGDLGPAIVPGKPAESLLITAINHGEFIRMPPKDKLPTNELVNLTRWVEMGAPWPDDAETATYRASEAESVVTAIDGTPVFTDEQRSFWAFQTPNRPELPVVRDSHWSKSAIDYFVLARLEEANLAPAPPADRQTLIRRATYDLTGLPPEPEHIAAFEQDTSEDAFATVIERLLSSPQYGEHWGRHWLDVARYADSNGLDENLAYANAFRYRDYVIAAFNDDKPYDRFVQEQIGGDLLDDDDPDDLGRYVATGFLAIGAKMLAEDDPVKMQMDIIDEQMNTLCQAFMGLTMGCARCHDHKFDPLPTADYYALAGIFKSSKTMENHKVVAEWYERPLVNRATAVKIDAIDNELTRITKSLTSIKNTVYARAKQLTRCQVAEYLLATEDLQNVHARPARTFSTRTAFNTRSSSDNNSDSHDVKKGYAVIEAEAYQRGDIERTDEHYGQDIGIVLSRGAGFAEYDLQVQHAGDYELELRYAAEDARPLRLLVNGEPVASDVARGVTGDWFPAGQAWFAETIIPLTAGANTIRFESDNVFPHVDKIALIYSTNDRSTDAEGTGDQGVGDKGNWPFETERPLTVSQIVQVHELEIELVRQWQSFLKSVAADKLPQHNAFKLWTTLANVDSADFDAAKTALLSSDDFQALPQPIRKSFVQADPQSLSDLAALYQQLVHRADVDSAWARHFPNKLSPLGGPENLSPFYSAEETAQRQQLDSERSDLEQSRPSAPLAMGVTEGVPADLRVHLRGSHITLGEITPRRLPGIMSAAGESRIANDQSGRLALAKWVTEKTHPLTSRVMVNRVWHWHFGRGIVSSVDNFGALGDRPTHPELLDWLAVVFTDNHWSLKQLHRTIMLSSTYQMSASHNPSAAEADPENKLLWRWNRRRLTAEEIRDSIVAVGQGIDGQMCGTLLATENHKYVNSTGSAMSATSYENTRRSVYLPVIRSSVYNVFQTLDFPDPAVISGARQTSTVAPQALLMMNSGLVETHTNHCATELIDRFDDTYDRIAGMYQRILRRSPTIQETEYAVSFLERAKSIASDSAQECEPIAWQSLCRVLMSTSEFIYVE